MRTSVVMREAGAIVLGIGQGFTMVLSFAISALLGVRVAARWKHPAFLGPLAALTTLVMLLAIQLVVIAGIVNRWPPERGGLSRWWLAGFAMAFLACSYVMLPRQIRARGPAHRPHHGSTIRLEDHGERM